MATQSVTISVHQDASYNILRVGGTPVAGFTVANPTYTVPVGKRLVLKSINLSQPAAAGKINIIPNTSSQVNVHTMVFGGGQVVGFTNSGSINAYGFLEDDV